MIGKFIDTILNEEDLPKTEYFHDIDPEIRSYYEKLWESVLLSD